VDGQPDAGHGEKCAVAVGLAEQVGANETISVGIGINDEHSND
jgi:hypothetical protein